MYRQAYAKALAASAAVWQAFQEAVARQQAGQRADEDAAVTLLLLLH